MPPTLRGPLLAASLFLPACASPTSIPAAPEAPVVSEAPVRPVDALSVRSDSLLIQVDSLRYTVAVDYPQIFGTSAGASAAAVRAANASIRDSVAVLARSFRPDAPVPADAPGFEHTEVLGGYDAPFLASDVFSTLIPISANTGGVHENFYALPLNLDLATGAPVRLADLFRPASAWADTLSAHVEPALVEEMTLRMRGRDGDAREYLSPRGYGPEALRTTPFTLGADSLALHFVPYQVAGFAWGSFRIAVAYADLAPLMRTDGVAGRLHP